MTKLLIAALFLASVFPLSYATAAPIPQGPQVTSGSTVNNSNGYTMSDSGGNPHTFQGGAVAGGAYSDITIDGKNYVWDPEALRYYRPGATPPDFSYYEFTRKADGGYNYKKKVPQIGGTATIETGTLV